MKIKPYYERDGQVIYNADCLTLMKQFPDKNFDLVLTDPPYGTTACAWDSVIPFEPMWKQLKRITKKNGAIVLFGSQPFTSALVMSNPKMFKYEWVWDKKKPAGFQLARYRPMIKHENILVFSQATPKYYPIRTPREKEKKNSFQSKSESSPLAYHDGKERVYKDYLPKSIIEVSNANQRNRVHPTQKPVALMEYLIKTYTNEKEIVLDFAMGSGTTNVATVRLGRRCVGIEISEKYCAIAKQRIDAELNQKKLF